MINQINGHIPAADTINKSGAPSAKMTDTTEDSNSSTSSSRTVVGGNFKNSNYNHISTSRLMNGNTRIISDYTNTVVVIINLNVCNNLREKIRGNN